MAARSFDPTGKVAQGGASGLSNAVANLPKQDPSAAAAQKAIASKVDPDASNYWKIEQRKAFASPYAKSAPEVLRLESEGLDDWTRKLELAVKREYFTLWQYIGGIMFGIALGIMITLLVFIYGLDFPFNMMGDDANVSQWQWGWFLVCFFLTEIMARAETRRQFHCDPYNKDVEPRRRGMDCLTNRDCTVQEHVSGGLCVRKTPGALVGFIRIYVPWIALVGGAILLVMADAPAPPRAQIAPAVLFGTSTGVLWAYTFS